jgi:hypothetical protein
MVINIEVITLVKFMMWGDWYEEGVWWEIAFVLVCKQRQYENDPIYMYRNEW